MRRVAACLLAVVFGPAAQAADVPVKASSAATALYNWTGWYVGGNVGYGWSTGDTTIGFSDPGGLGNVGPTIAAGALPVRFPAQASGAVGGLQLGYNYQLSRQWLVGAEVDFSLSGIDGTRTINTAVTGFFPIGNATSHQLNWFGTIRGRVGFTVEQWLFFATGGAAYGQVRDTYRQRNAPLGPINISVTDSATQWGWVLGGGVEYGFSNWTARLEYLYVDLGTHSFLAPSNFGTTVSFTPAFATTEHIVRAALNYRFR